MPNPSRGPEIPCLELKRAATSSSKPRRAAASCSHYVRSPRLQARQPTQEVPHLQRFRHGPGRTQTFDLGIKSPGNRAATNCGRLKGAATGVTYGCNELQQNAACGDEPVRALYTQGVDYMGNQPRNVRVRLVERTTAAAPPTLSTLRRRPLDRLMNGGDRESIARSPSARRQPTLKLDCLRVLPTVGRRVRV